MQVGSVVDTSPSPQCARGAGAGTLWLRQVSWFQRDCSFDVRNGCMCASIRLATKSIGGFSYVLELPILANAHRRLLCGGQGKFNAEFAQMAAWLMDA